MDTLVIGAGQVGLTTSYLLRKKGRTHIVVDAGKRVGDAWRNRWDSLVLFTTNRFNGLPGMPFPGARGAFATKDDMADYLAAYAVAHNLPIHLQTKVQRVERDGDMFGIQTTRGSLSAKNVIVAMSDFQSAHVPAFSTELRPSIVQRHSSQFTSAQALPDGPVLVVGMGNSGADIALDVARHRDVVLAGVPPGVIPFRIETWLGRNVLLPLVRFLGHHALNLSTPLGRRLIPRMRSMGGALVRVKPRDLEVAGVRRIRRVVGVRDGLPVDQDGHPLDVATVLWCTGFKPDWSWLDVPHVDDGGRPRQDRGVVAGVPGLYVVGWQSLYAATSSTVTGHARDCRYVVNHLTKHRPAPGL